MTSYSRLQTYVLAKFVDTTCIFRDAGAAVGRAVKILRAMETYEKQKNPYLLSVFFLRRFRDPIRVPRIREIGSLQVHTGYLTFSLKKTGYNVVITAAPYFEKNYKYIELCCVNCIIPTQALRNPLTKENDDEHPFDTEVVRAAGRTQKSIIRFT